MKTVKSIKSMQKQMAQLRRKGHKIAFVPTMGALHAGHLSLVRKALKAGDISVVSIFVNPAQFGPGEDLDNYPKSIRRDKRQLSELGVDYVFMPSPDDIYPEGFDTFVVFGKGSGVLEGKTRKGHFRGVATIVLKLFNIVQPHIACFGRKDYQQSILIQRMVRDLDLPIKIVVGPTVREKSGLALSSRNRYFDEEQLRRATVLYNGLMLGLRLIKGGERKSSRVVDAIKRFILKTPGTRIDYIAITDDNLEPLDILRGKFTISMAVWLDEVRLIDNISMTLQE